MHGEREAADVQRFLGSQTANGLHDAAMHLRLAAVGKKTLARHLMYEHGVRGQKPLITWTKDELEADHEDIHRRLAR